MNFENVYPLIHASEHHNWTNISNDLDESFPNACICELAAPNMHRSDYHDYNLYLIVIALPIVATFGIITNVMSFLVFTRGQVVMNSMDYYLAALAASDILVDWCGLFVIAVDSARRFSEFLTKMHLLIIPYILPVGYMAQMCSVYFTVFAAIDCYISIKKPKSTFCQKRFTKSTIYTILLCSFLYNCVTFLDLQIVECVDYQQDGLVKQEICPTDLRVDPIYMQIYKVYCYALFMAFIPFALLLVLNFLIMYFVYNKNSAHKASEVVPIVQNSNGIFKDGTEGAKNPSTEGESDSTITLVMVVVLFLICNSIGFAVNIVETFSNSDSNATEPNLDDQIQLMFVVDAGNFLVVLNSSANFLIYAAFSIPFRKALKTAWKKYTAKVVVSLQCINKTSFPRRNRKTDKSTTNNYCGNRVGRSTTLRVFQNRIYEILPSTNIVSLTLENLINRKEAFLAKRREKAKKRENPTVITNQLLSDMQDDDSDNGNSTCLIIENQNTVTYQACETNSTQQKW